MEPVENPTEFDVNVSYTCDHNTGRINLTIEYNSPSGTWPDDHERKHFEVVQRILDDSGILGPDSGELCIRVRRADVESIYYATRVDEELVWRLDSERQIINPPLSAPPFSPLPPNKNPVDPA